MSPQISICIPAYKRVEYLRRLLNSILIQTYKNFEIILSDDSPDDSVEKILIDFKSLPIKYFKNDKALGTPANWNFAISKASGEWIKLIHDDDWFSSPKSLETFAKYTNKKDKFIFSSYTNVFENEHVKDQKMFSTASWRKKIIKQPGILLAHNIIGPPSVTMIHSSIKEIYDERLKWRVDMEFYTRVLLNKNFFSYINESLVNVGVSDSQVTQSCIYNPLIELPEGYILLEKFGLNPLRNIYVYDAWWRLLRNMNIRNEKQLFQYSEKNWPRVIINMTADLNDVPASFLKVGVLSKAFMSLSYLKNRKEIN